MKMIFKSLFFMLASLSCFANSKTDITESMHLMDKVEFFYIDPTPETAKDIIKKTSQLQEYVPSHCIISALAKAYPKKIMGWIKEANIQLTEHTNFLEAMYSAGLEKEVLALAKKEHFSKEKISSFTKIKVFPSPSLEQLQQLAIHFNISGDIKYCKNILDVLECTYGKEKNLEKQQRETLMVLFDLMFKHDRVYQFCQEESKVRKNKLTQLVLQKQLEEIQKNFDNAPFQKNGPLQGYILITEDDNFEKNWDDLPLMAGPECQETTTIDCPKETKTLKSFIIFTGYELDKNLHAYVTYDVEISDPKGEKINTFENLLALKRKLPSRFFLQKADQPIGIILNATTDKGIYKIKATLKDHIGKREVQLSKAFTFLEPKTENAATKGDKSESHLDTNTRDTKDNVTKI